MQCQGFRAGDVVRLGRRPRCIMPACWGRIWNAFPNTSYVLTLGEVVQVVREVNVWTTILKRANSARHVLGAVQPARLWGEGCVL